MVQVVSIAILDRGGQLLQRATPHGRQHSSRLFTEVLGQNSDRLRVVIQLAPGGDAPGTLSVNGCVRDAGAPGTARFRFRATARQWGQPGRYLADVSLRALNGLMQKDSTREYCTVVREYGTSAALFARKLAGWKSRGNAVMPDLGKAAVSGDAMREIPDAKALMLTGGVEVLECWTEEAEGAGGKRVSTWAFIRSPADVVFYSGHGASWNGSLLRGTVFGHTYDDWLDPAELLVAWQANRQQLIGGGDIDLLVINGCSVLLWNLDPSTSMFKENRGSYGKTWAGLLKRNGGPLTALCGFRHTAPIDAPFGNLVAERFASRLAAGIPPENYAATWLDVCRHSMATWTACAWDNNGYRYINMPGINSYRSDLPAGAVVGPVAYPGGGEPTAMAPTITARGVAAIRRPIRRSFA